MVPLIKIRKHFAIHETVSLEVTQGHQQKIATTQISLQLRPVVVYGSLSGNVEDFHWALTRLTSRGHTRSPAENRDPSDFAQILTNGRV